MRRMAEDLSRNKEPDKAFMARASLLLARLKAAEIRTLSLLLVARRLESAWMRSAFALGAKQSVAISTQRTRTIYCNCNLRY